MTTYTDNQLKQALAKMLPEQIQFELGRLLWVKSIGPKGASFQVFVSDTELLDICRRIENSLHHDEKCRNHQVLFELTKEAKVWLWNASWQQRTIALAKVKGVEI